MTLTSFALIYVVVWWVVIFAVLPIGIKSVGESDEEQAEGVEEGAPLRPRLFRQALITTAISIPITLALAMAWPSISRWADKQADLALGIEENTQ